MNKNKFVKFLQSFVAIPLFAATMPLAGLPAMPATAVLSSNSAIESPAITTQDEAIRKAHIDAINSFLSDKNSPLAGYGEKFVDESYANDLDWRLLVAISGRETTFGKNMCKSPKANNNPFGWGSCKIGFKSIDESIEVLAKNLGGNNPTTAKHYDGKTTLEVLRKYNTVIPNYPKQVVKIMKMIDDTDQVE